MRPLRIMYQHVQMQAVGVGECVATRLADIRLIPRMFPHVHSQVGGRCERLVACLADIRLLP
jgi:hypothetical protein